MGSFQCVNLPTGHFLPEPLFMMTLLTGRQNEDHLEPSMLWNICFRRSRGGCSCVIVIAYAPYKIIQCSSTYWNAESGKCDLYIYSSLRTSVVTCFVSHKTAALDRFSAYFSHQSLSWRAPVLNLLTNKRDFFLGGMHLRRTLQRNHSILLTLAVQYPLTLPQWYL